MTQVTFSRQCKVEARMRLVMALLWSKRRLGPTPKKRFNWIAVSWYFRNQVGVISCLMYSTSLAFLRVRRLNIEINVSAQWFENNC